MTGWDQQGDIDDLRRRLTIADLDPVDRADVHAEQRHNRTTGLWLIVIAGFVTWCAAQALIGEPGLPYEPPTTAYQHPQPANP